MVRETIMKAKRNLFKEVAGASRGWALAMILMGLFAVILPRVAGIASSVLIAWLVVLCGLAHLALALVGRNAGGFVWRLLIGAVYIAGGGYLVFHPALARESFAVVLVVIFMLEGVLECVAYLLLRADSGSSWVLVNGLFTLFLAYIVTLPWPFTSIRYIGIVLGINLMLHGITVLLYLLTARKELEVLKS